MKLSGEQHRTLNEALISAFPTLRELERMIFFTLGGRSLAEIITGDNLSTNIFNLVRWAEAQGRLEDLIIGARRENPGNFDLLKVAQETGLAPKISARLTPQAPVRELPGQELERYLKNSAPFVEVSSLLVGLGKIANQVCRVEIELSNHKRAFGTGFLIGPRVVVTNYHVMEAVIAAEEREAAGKLWSTPQKVTLRFDYKRNPVTGHELPGKTYSLAPNDWLINCSPMSPLDHCANTGGDVPAPDQLDYALLRVAGTPGEEIIGDGPNGNIRRGWIKLPTEAPFYLPGSQVIIVQHPKADTLKAAIQTLMSLNANETRFTYDTNTEHGSSGSPCFDAYWQLIGIHHAGDPDYSIDHDPDYNQGVTITALMDLWQQRVLMDQIEN